MTNLEKYRQAFAEAFEVQPEETDAFVMGETEAWDSIGHMSLVASLEDAFGFELEPQEILAITSFEAGKKVLENKGIQF